jgi:glycosyltransferase involved in cell wall biosynthesis
MSQRPVHCSILAVGDFPEGGASSQRLYLLAKTLNEGMGYASLWILHPISKVPVRENISNAGEWREVKFIYLSGTTVRPSGVVGAFLDTVRGIYRSVRLIASRGKDRPDVLVLYTPTFLKFIFPMLVAKLFHVPMVVESCEIRSTSTDFVPGIIRRIANSGELLLERLIPFFAVGVLGISRGILQYYKERGLPQEAACLLPVLVDLDREQKCDHVVVEQLKGERFLLHSGSFEEKEGLVYLVQAVAKVHEEYPNIKLVFTGFATKSTQIKILEYAGSRTGAEWIIFTGFLSRQELIWCYKNAIGLLCCRSNSVYANYGFPTKLAEYLSVGRPVVATSVGDIKEYLADEETAFLAEPENVESIALAIRRLLHDPVHAEKIGQQGAEVARQYFDYRNHIEKVSNFIRRRIKVEDDE